MKESEIFDLIRTAPTQSVGQWPHTVEYAANQLVTMAPRLTESELEAMIALVALCYQKAGADVCALDEYRGLMKRLTVSAAARR